MTFFKGYNVAVLGATGLVGRTVLKILEEYNFPINNLVLFASIKSLDKEVVFKGKSYRVKQINEENIKDIDFAFLCVNEDISYKWAKKFEENNTIVIDNSKAYRMDDSCALIVPEVNLDEYFNKRKIISNPNCSTIQTVILLNALKKYGLKRVIYNTYQSVSGSGYLGILELEHTLTGDKAVVYKDNISKTCIPQIGLITSDGYSLEETKMIEETKKILNMPDLIISATCVRVPVKLSHGVSVVVELATDFNIEDVINTFKNTLGVVVVDEIPTSTLSNNSDFVYVGRIRKDKYYPNTLLFYCVADNIRRGAAYNAVKIALKINERKIAEK